MSSELQTCCVILCVCSSACMCACVALMHSDRRVHPLCPGILHTTTEVSKMPATHAQTYSMHATSRCQQHTHKHTACMRPQDASNTRTNIQHACNLSVYDSPSSPSCHMASLNSSRMRQTSPSTASCRVIPHSTAPAPRLCMDQETHA